MKREPPCAEEMVKHAIEYGMFAKPFARIKGIGFGREKVISSEVSPHDHVVPDLAQKLLIVIPLPML